MDSNIAIWLSECLKEVDGINVDWRALKKYAEDYHVKEGFYPIPAMELHKDDLIAQFVHDDEFDQICKEVNELEAWEMQEIADKMTDMMIEQFNLSAKLAFENFRENKRER